MSAARWLGVSLVVAAAAAGSSADRWRVPAPVHAGGYYVIAADFHVHAFPGDGALPGWELAREASRRGLHAIVISNHNQTLATHFAPKNVPGAFAGGVLIIPSQEVTTPRFHLVAVGISKTVDWRLPDVQLLDAIHAQGGVVIAAHPVGRYWRGSDEMLSRLDGAEIAHPLTGQIATGREELNAFFARARVLNPTLAPIGSTDFHMVAPLGLCRTFVFAESVSAASILDAIRAGRTVAQDQHGVRYGDPALIALLDETTAPAPPPVQRMAHAFVALALIGLLGIVIFD